MIKIDYDIFFEPTLYHSTKDLLFLWSQGFLKFVIPSLEVENNRYYSIGQHRGNVGEGQLHLNQNNIHEFDGYLTQPNDLEKAIRAAFKKEMRLRRNR